MKLLFGNFDFEHHLGRSAPRTLSATLKRINAELAGCLAALAVDGDFVWLPEPIESDFFPHLARNGFPDIRSAESASDIPLGADLVPWGWTEKLKNWGMRHGWRCDAPPQAVVARVNAREFSANLERDWNVGLEGAARLEHIDDFRCALEATADKSARWVIKANFGMSARERVLGRGRQPDEQVWGWLRRRFESNETVFFEPWVTRIEELGFQFTIPLAGTPVLEGITPLLTDQSGAYVGSRLDFSSGRVRAVQPRDSLERDERKSFAEQSPGFLPVLEIVERAALRIQQHGYFGPLGIDAMKYRGSDGEIRWRPLQDINARLTMGRLALGLKRWIGPYEHTGWLHVRWRGTIGEIREQLSRIDALLPGDARAIRTSPIEVGGRPASRGTFLVGARSPAAFAQADRILSAR